MKYTSAKMFSILHRSLLICFIIFGFISLTFAQLSFKSEKSFINDFYSSISLMTNDMNDDQQDDIITFEKGSRIVVHLNNGLGRSWKTIMGPSVGYCWSGIVGDFNNDGFMEIVAGSSFKPIRIYTFNHITEEFTLYEQFDLSFLVQNINCVDLNNDGWLDLFLCNDDGENFTMINDGTGTLVEEKMIDFSTLPASDLSGNYGSVFLDYDLDGDQDLYIAKCRGLADLPTDPRRINQLFVNDGNNSFEDKAEEFGLDFGQQSWVADFADLDLDGDNDLIVANHFDELLLLRNIDNVSFEEIQNGCGIELQNSFWQLSYADLDNDGYQDVIISSDDLYIYRNNGDFTFTQVEIGQTMSPTRDFAVTIGDYNNDGFLDLCTGYGAVNSVGIINDSIWINQTNDNNWVAFDLEGTSSNKNGIGATVYCYSEAKSQFTQIKAGHSYGIQNHSKAHFGLGQELIDSVKIVWPSGIVEIIINPQVNRVHRIREGGCQLIVQSTEILDNNVCVGQPLDLSLSGGDLINWANGSEASQISYEDYETIFATYSSNGCTLNSWKVFPDYHDTSKVIKETEILTDLYAPCPDEVISINLNGSDHVWSNGNTGHQFESKQEEEFTVDYHLVCGEVTETFSRTNINWEFDEPSNPIVYTSGEDIEVNVKNPETNWYKNVDDPSPFNIGSSFVFENVIEDDTFYLENAHTSLYDFSIGLAEPATTASAPGSSVNPIVYFTIKEALTLKSIDVYTAVEGPRKFQIATSQFSYVFEQLINLDEGATTLDIDLFLEPGDYLITTDGAENVTNFGATGPLLFREISVNSMYPFMDEKEAMELTGHSFSNQQTYYSFYNWAVEAQPKYCVTERIPIRLQNITEVTEDEFMEVRYNNPVRDLLLIESEGKNVIKLLDLHGRVLLESQVTDSSEIDLRSFAAGTYILMIKEQSFRIIKL